jgi:hypothetical protein
LQDHLSGWLRVCDNGIVPMGTVQVVSNTWAATGCASRVGREG